MTTASCPSVRAHVQEHSYTLVFPFVVGMLSHSTLCPRFRKAKSMYTQTLKHRARQRRPARGGIGGLSRTLHARVVFSSQSSRRLKHGRMREASGSYRQWCLYALALWPFALGHFAIGQFAPRYFAPGHYSLHLGNLHLGILHLRGHFAPGQKL